jgi:hypothetical protein
MDRCFPPRFVCLCVVVDHNNSRRRRIKVTSFKRQTQQQQQQKKSSVFKIVRHQLFPLVVVLPSAFNVANTRQLGSVESRKLVVEFVEKQHKTPQARKQKTCIADWEFVDSRE